MARCTLVLLGLLLWQPVHSQAQPTELYKCVISGYGGHPDCGLESVLQIDFCADRTFLTYYGRVSWFPLANHGPVIIEVEANPSWSTHFPLYVEILPLASPAPRDFCLNGHPGIVVGETYGSGYCGAEWVSFGPIDLDPFVPQGGTYALQLQFFETVGAISESPGIDCVRVRAAAAPASVVPATWSHAKSLYR